MGRFQALSSRDFRLLFFGQLVSLTGTQMQHIATLWQLYKLTGSPVAMGVVGLWRFIPLLLFAAYGGVLADAIDRRKLMIISQSALATASVVLLVATLTDTISPALIYAVLFFSGIATAFDAPARHSLVPQLVPEAVLPNALSLNITGWQIAAITGPAIGGLIVDSYGALPIYIIDVASFLAVIGALLAMKHRHAPIAKMNISLRQAIEGLIFLRKSPLIFSAMLLDFFATFFGGSLLMLPFFAEKIFGAGSGAYGLLAAAQPIGAAVCAMIVSSLPAIKNQGRVLLISVAVYGAAVAAFGVSPYLSLSFLLLAVSGAADTVSMVIRQTIRQLNTPDELRGRMTSINMVFFMGGPQLGEVEAGYVAKAIGIRGSVATGGLACIVAVMVVGALAPTLRRYVFKPAPS